MKKAIPMRVLPDLLIILVASVLSVLTHPNFQEVESIYRMDLTALPESFLTIINLVSILFFYLSASFMVSFYFLQVYNKTTFTLLKKLKKPFIASILSLFLISFIFLMTNISNISFQEGSILKNSIVLELQYLNYALAWFFSSVLMLGSRTWIYYYSKVNFSEYELSKKYENKNTVFVIGGAGYIGSSLIGELLKNGYLVKVLDVLFFGIEPIQEYIDHPNFTLIQADFRKVDDLVLGMQECHTVVHLGGLVGDPACTVDEFLTTEVNLTSTKIIGQIAKAAGVKRLIFASSCSVYGAQEELLDEESNVNPLSLYAKTKLASEYVLQELASEDFSPVILRFSTVFGLSGRTRFDLVVNLLAAKSYVEKNMTVFGANQTRPFIHVADAAKSILLAIKAPTEVVHNEIFNIGCSDLNYTLIEVAEFIKKQLPDANITIEKPNEDARNYNVSFSKAAEKLNFKISWSLEDGISQVIDRFKKGEIIDYTSPLYSNFMHMSESGRDVLGSLEYSGWEKELLKAQNTSS